MFDNALTVIVLAVIIAVAVVAIVTKFLNQRKLNPDDKTSETLKNITGVLQEQALLAFQKALELREADKGGFEAVKKYVVDQIMEVLSNSTLLGKTEKALLSRSIIEQLITPFLQGLWDYKLEIPDKNMTKATLRKLRAED